MKDIRKQLRKCYRISKRNSIIMASFYFVLSSLSFFIMVPVLCNVSYVLAALAIAISIYSVVLLMYHVWHIVLYLMSFGLSWILRHVDKSDGLLGLPFPLRRTWLSS